MTPVSRAVFLSYASQDAEAARRICESLRTDGVEVWFDADGGLEHGDEWDAKIRLQIKESVLFIPLISANTQARHEGYFRLEWELAAERAMSIASGVPFILPVVIDDTREPDALVPDRFRKVQWTRLPGGEITPEVRARFLKLWSHRIGAVAHEEKRDTTPAPQSLPEVGRPLRGRHGWIAAAIAGAILAAGFFEWGRRNPDSVAVTPAEPAARRSAPPTTEKPAPAVSEKSVVVLPLENLSPDPENAFFTEGMHTEMIATLQRLPDLKVISRNSALAFKSANLSVAEFAKKLSVANVISGSVRRDRDRVRIQLELRRAADDALLWTPAPYERDLKDRFAIQSEIATEVGRVLQARQAVGTAESARLFSTDPRAFDLFVKGKELLYAFNPTPAQLREGVLQLEEAVKLDPTFWYAVGYLSAVHSQFSFVDGLDPKERAIHATEAKRLAEQGLQMAPSGLGGGALAYYYLIVAKDFVRALALAEENLRALPGDAERQLLVGHALNSLGRIRDALVVYRQANELDPLNPASRAMELASLGRLRRTEGSEELAERFSADFPDGRMWPAEFKFRLRGELPRDVTRFSSDQRAVWLMRARRYEEAAQVADSVLAEKNTGDSTRFQFASVQTAAMRRLGRTTTTAAQTTLSLAENLRAAAIDPEREAYRFSLAYAATGRIDEAVAAGQRNVQEITDKNNLRERWEREEEFARLLAQVGRVRESVVLIKHLLQVPSGLTVPMLKIDPAWDNLRDDPEFKALLADPKNSAAL